MTYVPPCWLDIFIYDKPAHCSLYCVFIKQQWFFSSLKLCENTKFYQLKWLQYLLFFQCQVSSSLPPLRRVLQDYGQWNGCWQESSRSLSVKVYGKEKKTVWGYKPVTLQHVPTQCQDMARPLGDGGECPGGKLQFWVMGPLPKEKQLPTHPTLFIFRVFMAIYHLVPIY